MSAPLQKACALGLASIKVVQGSVTKISTCSNLLRISVCAPGETHSTPINNVPVRNVSFINSNTVDQLWSGVVNVSNAGKKRGRGKRVGRKKVTDLYRGQRTGIGKQNINWPGLTGPVIQNNNVQRLQKLPPNPNYEKEILEKRDQLSQIRYPALAPLERGWSGKYARGRSYGPPDKVVDYEFEGFDSRVLEFKLVTNMTGNLGRKMQFSAFVAVGNGKGMVGLALGKAQRGVSAIKIAKNKAAQRLQYVELFENHTVFHNMFTHMHRTKVFIHKKEKGYGLRCHRCLKTLCELIGISDLHCKVEGSTGNMQVLARAFVDALVQQETHQQLADRVGYHVVETRPERNNLPTVVASPSDGIVNTKLLQDEEEDLEMAFERLYYNGKVEYDKPKLQPFYTKFDSYKKKEAIVHKRRNQHDVKLLRRAGLANI